MRPLAVALALVSLIGCTDGDPAVSSGPPTTRETGAGSSISADCQRGPWAEHCPEADWARAVVTKAGYRLRGDTGSALTATDGQVIFHLWAFVPERESQRLDHALIDENYRELRERVAGIRVYTDGIRFVWSAQGLRVWLTSAGIVDGAPGGTPEEVGGAVLLDLVTATVRTRFE